MSTTARKLRKRSGEKFVHPSKTPTPFLTRIENQPRPIFGNPLSKQATRYGLTKSAERRLKALIPEDLAPVSALELDPKPYRVGRNRFTIEEFKTFDPINDNAVFSPRAKYEQRASQYGLDA